MNTVTAQQVATPWWKINSSWNRRAKRCHYPQTQRVNSSLGTAQIHSKLKSMLSHRHNLTISCAVVGTKTGLTFVLNAVKTAPPPPPPPPKSPKTKQKHFLSPKVLQVQDNFPTVWSWQRAKIEEVEAIHSLNGVRLFNSSLPGVVRQEQILW